MNDDSRQPEHPTTPETTPAPLPPAADPESASADSPPVESAQPAEGPIHAVEPAPLPAEPAITAEAAPTPIEPAPLISPPLLSPPPPAEPISHPFVFHGRTDEYFRIWIVNTLLTLLTLGVFFAWAKVRKRRYLRGCTELLGHRFDYRANPFRLLIGHIVVLMLFLGYSLFGVVYPAIKYGVVAVAIIMLPWIVVRSFTFNAHNTVYRGLRFRFNASLSAALKVYLLEPLLIVATLGIYYPAWQRSKRAYAVNNHRLGDAYFKFTATVGHFYSSYVFAGLIVLAGAFMGGLIAAVLVALNHGGRPTFVQALPFFVCYAFGYYVGRHLLYALLFNHIWNHTRLDEHHFIANLDPGKWLGLQLTNLGAIIISVGMLYPWAMIRAQHYAASCLRFAPAGSIESIQRIGGTAGSATGDMAAEFIGIDFGL